MRDGRDGGYRHYDRGDRRNRVDEQDIQAELEDYAGQDSPPSPHYQRSSRSYSRSPKRRDRRRYERRRSRTPSPRSHSRERYSRRSRRDSRSRSPEKDRWRYKRRDSDYGGDYRRERRDDYGHRREYRREDREYHRGRDTKEDYRTREESRYDGKRRADRYIDDEPEPLRRKPDAESLPEGLPPPPPPPPPQELWPRSPDISATLTSLATSQDLSFDKEHGIQDSGLLYSRLSHLAGLLLGPTVESWNEQEEQCRLLRLKVGICVKSEDDNEPFSKDITPDVEPTDVCVDIPYVSDGEVKDPRCDYTKEYELMSAWVMKPRPLPGFAEETLKRASEPESPTHSWSMSPKQIASNLERKAQRTSERKEQRKVGRNTSIAPEFKKQSPAGSDKEIELEEGYFSVKLVNGEDRSLQYGEIVDMIKKGELPDGWPAYRDVDSLWVSVSAKEGPVEKQDPVGNKEEASVASDSLVLEITKGQDVKDILPWIKDVSNRADKALKSAKYPVILQYARGGESAGRREFDFKEEAKIASESQSEHQSLISMRRNGKILCGTPKPVSPSTLAMIKGYILSDRSTLRDIATGALQKALKSLLDRKNKKN